MRAKYLALALAFVVAAPTLATAAAKHKTAAPAEAAAPDHEGPVPYADLAAIDAKLNAAPTVHAKKHRAHKKAAAASASTSAPAPAAAPAK